MKGAQAAGVGAEGGLPGADGGRGGGRAGGLRGGPWGQKYPGIARSWRSAWDRVVPFFAFSAPIRRAIYTTNAIESLNSTVRRAIRTRGHFPNDRAATKLIYLALRGVESKWRRPPPFWQKALSEFSLVFGDRFVVEAS